MNSDSSSAPLTKLELRLSMRQSLRAIPMEQRAAWSSEIRRNLQQDRSWLPSTRGTVALFGGIPSEPDLLPLMPWLSEQGLQTVLFSITEDLLVPRLVCGMEDLRKGVLGVLEPDAVACPAVPLARLDSILVPGLAFSRTSGLRLGKGKGHYDRVLAQVPAESRRIGVCFELQLLDLVPCEAHDLPVQSLVTENGWLWPGR